MHELKQKEHFDFMNELNSKFPKTNDIYSQEIQERLN